MTAREGSRRERRCRAPKTEERARQEAVRNRALHADAAPLA